MTRARKLLVLGNIAFVLVACAVYRSGSLSSSPSSSSPAAASTTAAETTTATFDRSKAPGVRHDYSVQFDQDLALTSQNNAAKNKGNSNTSVKLRLTANLSLAFVAHVNSQHRFFAELSSVSFTTGDQKTPEMLAMDRELAKPFYILADRDGRVRSYWFARDLSPTSANILRGLISGTQVAMHDGAGEESWTASEDDIQGSYVATYSRAGDGTTITKTKKPYDRIATMSGVVAADKTATVEARMRGVATVDGAGWLTKLTVDEHRKASMGEGMPIATTDIRIVLSATGAAHADPGLLGRFEQDSANALLAEGGAFGTGDEAAARRASDARTAGNMTMDEALAKAHGLSSAKSDDVERSTLTAQLSARMRLHPEDVARTPKLAKTGSAADAELVISALGGTATKESTAALGTILTDVDAPVAARSHAATSLAFAREHASEARDPLIRALSDTSPEVKQSAALALGNVARDLDADTESVGELVRRYENATSDDERELYLRALGNSGAIEVLPLARAALATNQRLTLREAGAHALRFLPIGDADALLDRVLLGDPSDAIRSAAIESIGYRLVETHARTLDRLLGVETSTRVRSALADVLARALGGARGKTLSPEGRDLLVALSRKLTTT